MTAKPSREYKTHMSVFKIARQEAFQHWPHIVQNLERDFVTRKTRIKNPSRDPAIIKWTYRTSVQVLESGTLEKVIAKARCAAGLKTSSYLPSLDEMVQDEVRRTRCLLSGSAQHWSRAALLHVVPPLVQDQIRADKKRAIQDRQTWDSLPATERDRRLTNLLRQLSLDPGFMCANIKRHPTDDEEPK